MQSIIRQLKMKMLMHLRNKIFSRCTEEVIQEEKNEIAELRSEIENLNKRLDSISKQLTFAIDRQYYFNAYTNPELLKLHSIPDHGVLLCGNYGNPNTGDEWMLDTMISYIRRYTKRQITIMLEPNRLFDPSVYLKYGIEYIHYPKTVYDYDLIEKKFDVLIFGGGAIIQDDIYWEAYDYGINICRTVVDLPLRFIAKKKKVICLGLSTSTELTNREYIEKLQAVINGSTFFSMRDPYSIGTLEKAGICTDKVQLVHDIVYANEELGQVIEGSKHEKNDADVMHVGLVYIVAEETKPLFRSLIDKIKKETEDSGRVCKITIIPFFDDWHIDYRFYMDEVKDDSSVTVLRYDSDIKMVIDVFMKQDIVVCARYHAILLALSLGVPCVALYYDTHQHYCNKVSYLMEQFGKSIENCVRISEIERCETLLDQVIREMDPDRIKALAKDARKQISKVLEREM